MSKNSAVLLESDCESVEIKILLRVVRNFKRRIHQMRILIHNRASRIRQLYGQATSLEKSYLEKAMKRRLNSAQTPGEKKFWGKLLEPRGKHAPYVVQRISNRQYLASVPVAYGSRVSLPRCDRACLCRSRPRGS